jgi:hypothetical protein
MERRYAVRYEEMMAEAVVKPEAFEGCSVSAQMAQRLR